LLSTDWPTTLLRKNKAVKQAKELNKHRIFDC
jgi:hypothetical protein